MGICDFCSIEDLLVVAICQSERYDMKRACKRMNEALEEINDERRSIYFEYFHNKDRKEHPRAYEGFKMCEKWEEEKPKTLYEVYNCGMHIEIWKPTDIDENPEYKGDSLSKVIPSGLSSLSEVGAALNAQHWIYW